MKNEPISDFLRSRIAEKDFPSAVYLVAEKGEIIFTDALGFAVESYLIQIGDSNPGSVFTVRLSFLLYKEPSLLFHIIEVLSRRFSSASLPER